MAAGRTRTCNTARFRERLSFSPVAFLSNPSCRRAAVTAATNPLFSRLARNADLFVTRCAFEASLAIAAENNGLDIAALREAPDPNAVRYDRGDARRINDARHEALYLTIMHFGRSQRSVSRATGLTQPAVLKAISAVEERREAARYDRRLDEIELSLMEAAA
jgi:hypothetical protein